MPEIDVIVLQRKNDNTEWTKQCLESISKHPVNILLCDAIDGDTRLARKLSFEKATSEYVSYVDIDDFVVTDIPIFDICLKKLRDNPNLCGVSTRSYIITEANQIPTRIMTTDTEWTFEKHFFNVMLVHQVIVTKTELVQKICKDHHNLISPLRYSDHQRELLLSQYGDWKLISEVGYVWRKHNNAEHSLNILQPINQYSKIKELVISKRKNLVSVA